MEYCKEFAALLDPYVDGALNAEDTARVKTHLQSCIACRAYVADALAIRKAFPTVEDTVVPDGFADRVMASIRADDSSRKTGAPDAPRSKKHAPSLRVLAPLAACFAVLLLVQSLGAPGSEKNAVDSAPAPALYSAAPEDTAGSSERALDAPAEAAPAESAPMEAAPSYEGTSQADNPFVYLTLTAAQAGALLDEVSPLSQEEDGQTVYRISREEYTALLDALAQSGVSLEETVSAVGAEDGDFAEITVTP